MLSTRTISLFCLLTAMLSGCWNFELLECRKVRNSTDCQLVCVPPGASEVDCFIDVLGDVFYRPGLAESTEALISVPACGGSVEFRSLLHAKPSSTSGTTCDGDPYIFDGLPYYKLGPRQ